MRITTTKSCYKLHHMECKKFLKLITFTENSLDEESNDFKTIHQQATNKNLGHYILHIFC